jgi:thiol-disulfide isomerase/thioredoxin
MVNRERNSRGRFLPSKPIDVRDGDQAAKLDALIHTGPVTFVLVYADWCGHCQQYKSTWHELENTPGRVANIASVHHDMMEKVPTIKDAKIQGYPSVIKVTPTGEISEYKVPGSEEVTNALPNMRDVSAMKKELTTAPKNSGEPGVQLGVTPNIPLVGRLTQANQTQAKQTQAKQTQAKQTQAKQTQAKQTQAKQTQAKQTQAGGAFGSVANAFIGAVEKAGPAGLLLLALGTLTQRRNKTYKSPKRSSRRASTRRNRK